MALLVRRDEERLNNMPVEPPRVYPAEDVIISVRSLLIPWQGPRRRGLAPPIGAHRGYGAAPGRPTVCSRTWAAWLRRLPARAFPQVFQVPVGQDGIR